MEVIFREVIFESFLVLSKMMNDNIWKIINFK